MKPEIYKDELSDELYSIIKNNDFQTILEIGCASGEGSTSYLTSSIIENSKNTILYGIEFNKEFYNELINRYKNLTFCKFYNVSSVNFSEFLSDEYIKFFKLKSQVSPVTPEIILEWKHYDFEYLSKNKMNQNGIELIKKENKIEYFDFVLLDGSPFTGYAEFNKIFGAEYIVLDDINDIKHNDTYHILKNSNQYILYKENWELRNGYAIFKKQF